MLFQNSSFICGFIAGSSIYAVCQWMYDRLNGRRIKADYNTPQYLESSFDDCIFFSPKMYIRNCSKDFCEHLSCPSCNYKKFIKLIMDAKTSLDICVYLITSEELSSGLISLFKRGVHIRIIIDKQMSDEAFNSKICVFLKEHVPIKIISNGETMHNKFVIIDKEMLITGSFNWTRQAVLSNYENAVIIFNKKIIRKYTLYFQDIWLSNL